MAKGTVFYNSAPIRNRGNRPWADVKLKTGSSTVTLNCIVDTGADYLTINKHDATNAGISLAGATPCIVTTVAGKVTMQLVSGVTVSIEGSHNVTVDVLVDSSNNTKPQLLGRTALLAPFNVGFEPTEWFHT